MTPHIPPISSEFSWALFEHWCQCRREAMVPEFELLTSVAWELGDLLPWAYMLSHAPAGLAWRFIGTGLAELLGGGLIGRPFETCPTPTHDPRFLDIYGGVTGQPCGAVIRCSGRTDRDRSLGMEQLVLPVRDPGGQVSIVLAHVAFLGDGEAVAEGSGRLESITLDGFQCFDIGAGIAGGGRRWTERGEMPDG